MNKNLLNYTKLVLYNHIINSQDLKKFIELLNNFNIDYNINNFDIEYNLDDIEYYKENYNIQNENIMNISDSKILFYQLDVLYKWDINKFTNLKSLIILNDRYIQDKYIKLLNNLETLILPKNKLLTDKSIKDLNNIRVLELNYNKNITNLSLVNKKNLQKLSLVFNKKINDEAFKKITSLESLNLGYNNNRKLNLEFLKYNNNIRTLILYRKKNISEEIKNIIENIEFKITPCIKFANLGGKMT